MTATLGFLTVRHHIEHGYFGGYLVVNEMARPLEFQCTMAVRPSRAQEVLYGPTLEDFVCGEQIAAALVAKGKVKPDLCLTDCRPVLALTQVSKYNLGYVRPLEDQTHKSLRTPSESRLPTNHVDFATIQIEVPEACSFPPNALSELSGTLHPSFDFEEPFLRIVEALEEAHPITKAAYLRCRV